MPSITVWIITWVLIIILILVLAVILYLLYKKFSVFSFLKKQEETGLKKVQKKGIKREYFDKRIEDIERKMGE